VERVDAEPKEEEKASIGMLNLMLKEKMSQCNRREVALIPNKDKFVRKEALLITEQDDGRYVRR
jgi:hypothetical protein